MTTANVFLQNGYAWKSTFRIHNVDANKVGREIDAIGGETATRDDIIAAGVGGKGELAKCFTQDRDDAAQKRWRDEADYLMRHLVPVIVDTRTEEERPSEQRAWVPVYATTQRSEDSGIYQRVVAPNVLPPDTKPDRQMAGWVALMAWRDKYGDDPLFAPVIAAIDALKA